MVLQRGHRSELFAAVRALPVNAVRTVVAYVRGQLQFRRELFVALFTRERRRNRRRRRRCNRRRDRLRLLFQLFPFLVVDAFVCGQLVQRHEHLGTLTTRQYVFGCDGHSGYGRDVPARSFHPTQFRIVDST